MDETYNAILINIVRVSYSLFFPSLNFGEYLPVVQSTVSNQVQHVQEQLLSRNMCKNRITMRGDSTARAEYVSPEMICTSKSRCHEVSLWSELWL